MAKAKQKNQLMGYGLEINRTGEPGAKNWERAGYLFTSKQEALTFRERFHPTAVKAKVGGIRLNVVPLAGVSSREDKNS